MAEVGGLPPSYKDLSEMPPELLTLGKKITEYYRNLDPNSPTPESEMAIKFRKVKNSAEDSQPDV